LLDRQRSRGGQKSGYSFDATAGAGTPPQSYTTHGTPITVGSTGQRSFFSDESGVIRFNTTGATASVADNPTSRRREHRSHGVVHLPAQG